MASEAEAAMVAVFILCGGMSDKIIVVVRKTKTVLKMMLR